MAIASFFSAIPGIAQVYSFIRNCWTCLPDIIQFLVVVNFGIICMLCLFRTLVR